MTLMIDFPFPSAQAWAEHFKEIELPVLRHTTQKLAELRDNAATINTRALANIVLHDPLMTLRILRYMKLHRGKSQTMEITTIERSLVMIGMENFFENCQELPTIEQQLRGHPKAMLGLLKVIARSRHASSWSRDWAVLRQNTRFEEISLAALLHDFVEILMYCFAPTLATRARERLNADHTLRTQQVQEEIFGAPLNEIMSELVELWGLPQLLLALLNPTDDDSTNVKYVSLAVDLSRHSANGWDDAALPDDFKAVENFLFIDHSHLLERIGAPEEMIQAAREAEAASDNPLI